MKLSFLSTVATTTFWFFTATATSAVPVDVDAVTAKDFMDSNMKALTGEEEESTLRKLGIEDADMKLESGAIPSICGDMAGVGGEVEEAAIKDGSGSLNPFRRLLSGFGKVRGLRTNNTPGAPRTVKVVYLPPPPNYYPSPVIWANQGPFNDYNNDDTIYERTRLKYKIRNSRLKPGETPKLRKLMVDP